MRQRQCETKTAWDRDSMRQRQHETERVWVTDNKIKAQPHGSALRTGNRYAAQAMCSKTRWPPFPYQLGSLAQLLLNVCYHVVISDEDFFNTVLSVIRQRHLVTGTAWERVIMISSSGLVKNSRKKLLNSTLRHNHHLKQAIPLFHWFYLLWTKRNLTLF